MSIAELIAAEEQRQKEGLELIASENFTSPAVRQAVGSVLTHKYAEGLPGKRYYGGCEVVDEVERLAIQRAKACFGAVWANVQPHSGSQANMAVIMALLRPGERILGFDLSDGGHLTHGAKVNFSGQLYEAHAYGVEPEDQQISWDRLAQTAQRVQPRLIICGGSAYSRDWDYARLRTIADSVGALLMGDIAHTAGLIACGLLANPLPHCHVVTTTTHKTLRGPRGGLILMGKEFPNPLGRRYKTGKLKPTSSLLNASLFPGIQGGPLMHVIAGKAVAFQEVLSQDFRRYAQGVRANAQALCIALQALGYPVVSGGTDSHLFLIDLSTKGLSGRQAEEALQQAGITVNKNKIPFDPRSALETSGIRLGTPALTTRGLVPSQMGWVAELIDRVLQKPDNPTVQAQVKAQIKAQMAPRPLFCPAPAL